MLYVALGKTQWSALVTGRYMITMMVLLCYVNLSGTSLECIVIVLMNNSLLGGQECTDYVNIQQDGDRHLARGQQAIIPRLNFTCNGRITNITARVASFDSSRSDYPFLQVWRPASVGSTTYNKIDEVQLSDDQVTGNDTYQIASIILTGNNTIEVQSGDVVGYYHSPQSRYIMRDIITNGYVQYRFDGSPVADNINLNQSDHILNFRQPLLQFAIGM